MRDIQITLGTGSTPYIMQPGEELQVSFQQLPNGAVQTVQPNPSSNPFVIPNQDETACYLVKVNKKCVDGSLGGEQSIQVGNCDVNGGKCYSYYLQNNTQNALTYDYQQCDGTLHGTETLQAGSSTYLCARENSVSTESGITVTNQGGC